MSYVGIRVECSVCGLQKRPHGRSAPMTLVMCEPEDCVGYDQLPLVGCLWPGETSEDFGYSCCNLGTQPSGNNEMELGVEV